MIILGLVLLVLGWVFAIHLLFVLGVIALLIGLVLLIAGRTGHEVGGRRHYW